MKNTLPSPHQPALFEDEFHPLNAWLDKHYPCVSPGEFYRELFPLGALEKAGEEVEGKYRGIAIRIKDGKARRFFINDGLEILDNIEAATPDEFWLASPVSYAGRTQRQEMARHLYAVAIDLDGIRIEDPHKPRGLEAMWNQIDSGFWQPCPTFIVSSGTGLHMYYLLETPIALYKPVIRQLQRFRHDLITRVWSSFVTDQYERPQYESVTQGFRLVGTYSKTGRKVRAWRVGPRVSVEYLNKWAQLPNQLTEVSYKSRLTLSEAKEKYPQWYQSRIVEGKPKGSWTVKPALYEWWRDKKLSEARTGHRYFYLMVLAIYAMKCGISEEQLHQDAWNLAPELRKQDQEGNYLQDSDIIKALEMYNTNYQTFPRHSIEAISGIRIDPNKRNYQTRRNHLEVARAVRDIKLRQQGRRWTDGNSRKGCPNKNYPKREIVKRWREANPNGRKIDCERETGISRPTVLKWWDA